MSGMEGFAIPAAGAAIGAIANKKNPLQGAMMGGLMGYGAGQMMPGMMGATGAGTAAASGVAGGVAGGTGVVAPAGLMSAGGASVASAVDPVLAGFQSQGMMSGGANLVPQGIVNGGVNPLAAQGLQTPANAVSAITPRFGQSSSAGVFDKLLGKAPDMAGRLGANMLQGGGQQQRQQQPVMGAAAPPLNPSAGAGNSFMSGAPGGTTINTLPGGTLPTASRFRRWKPSNNYSDYGME